MKELNTTNEMSKFQGIAKKVYTENKVIDIDAIKIGWKIETGRLITVEGREIEITGEPERNLYDVVLNWRANGVVDRKSQMNITQIAQLILIKNATVYYSK